MTRLAVLQRVWATIETKEAKQGKSAACVQQARTSMIGWRVIILVHTTCNSSV